MFAKPDSCKACVGWNWGPSGYVPAEGTGANGCLMVLEAAGEDEAKAGRPTVGKAGQYLWGNLQRVGIEREGWRIHNALSCQPPENKLAKQPYEVQVIASCSPLLDATISDMRERCRASGKHLVVLALGRIAFARIMGLPSYSKFLDEEYYCYSFWSERYGAWVLSAPHPSYLMRGNNAELPILQFAAQRALEIASNGFAYEQPTYILDPEPAVFQGWVREYKAAAIANPDDTFLSFDIETPYKKGKREDQLDVDGDDGSVILRCSFAYRDHEGVSIPWAPHYMPALMELFAADSVKIGWNCDLFDVPRIQQHMPIGGTILDAMVAWHILHAAMPKGLGFVTPFYAPYFSMWKHLSDSQPALYSAIDALAALRCWKGIQRDLKANDQWHVYGRHVLHLNKALRYMSNKGLMRDETRRQEAEEKLQVLLGDVEVEMQNAVPAAARQEKAYKKQPKNTEGLLTRLVDGIATVCPLCGQKPKKDHFKTFKKKVNPCAGASPIDIPVGLTQFYKLLPWKVSKVALIRYQKVQRHQPILDRDKKVTFDGNALKRLRGKYPKDPLYPIIGKQRHLTKMLSVYIGRTMYEQVEVSDDYQLKDGEKWANA